MARERKDEGFYWTESKAAVGCLPVLALGLLLDVIGVALMLAVLR